MQSQHALSRRPLPRDRAGKTHSVIIGGHHITIITGEYEDGTLGEVFLEVDKAGSTMSGILDRFATMLSLGLQYGAPLVVLADKMIDERFEPSGFTGNPDIPYAASIVDYVGRWLLRKYP